VSSPQVVHSHISIGIMRLGYERERDSERGRESAAVEFCDFRLINVASKPTFCGTSERSERDLWKLGEFLTFYVTF